MKWNRIVAGRKTQEHRRPNVVPTRVSTMITLVRWAPFTRKEWSLSRLPHPTRPRRWDLDIEIRGEATVSTFPARTMARLLLRKFPRCTSPMRRPKWRARRNSTLPSPKMFWTAAVCGATMTKDIIMRKTMKCGRNKMLATITTGRCTNPFQHSCNSLRVRMTTCGSPLATSWLWHPRIASWDPPTRGIVKAMVLMCNWTRSNSTLASKVEAWLVSPLIQISFCCHWQTYRRAPRTMRTRLNLLGLQHPIKLDRTHCKVP
mmetsp:Transcript_86/g.178  ORF Transcript_86/g.178 Transcript_86/m.178 type:complete len:260 (+) Transcript_86:1099-1878(+)